MNITNLKEKFILFLSSLKTKKKLIIVISILILILISTLVIFLINKNKTKPTTPISNTSDQSTPFNIGFEFAKYNLINTPFKASIPNYSISISDLYNINDFEKITNKSFSDSQKNALTSSNFFISQNLDKFWNDNPEAEVRRQDDWSSEYKKIGGDGICTRAPENSVFVSTDFLLHVYHRLLEKEFEYIENKIFYSNLSEITNKVFDQAVSNYSQQTDTDNKASYQRIIAFFAVPKVILNSANLEFSSTDSTIDQKSDTDEIILKNLEDLKSIIPEESYQKAKAELILILDNKTIAASPLFDEFLSKQNLKNPQDYTQFTPRSHYAKNSVLRSYFRAMMWYGRNNFIVSSPELTRDALNISLLMKFNGQLKNWENIYITTSFLVGKSDDLGINEYNSSLETIGTDVINSKTIAKVQDSMKNYQNPQIQSSVFVGEDVFDTTKNELIQKTKGFRFMGQRFTPDAFIFSSLTQGSEKPDDETKQSLPSSTTASLIMSILGNKTADAISQNWINTNAPNSINVLNKNINKLKTQFSQISENVWTQNIYWGWLYNLKSLYTGDIDKTGYPMFVKNDDWNKKSLQTALGSWTELKHDTLLYAKQSYAEAGGGGDCDNIPAVPKGYVETNILFFDRLIALANMTNDGLENRDLVNQSITWRNSKFIDALNFFKEIAVKELQNEKISDEDFEKLRLLPGSLDFILSPFDGPTIEKNSRSALIADVHTNIVDQNILYEADGIPNYIYVAVKDQNGTRLTKGLVFNYYEFTSPIMERLTDESWQSKNYTLDKSQLPPSPDWIKSLIK